MQDYTAIDNSAVSAFINTLRTDARQTLNEDLVIVSRTELVDPASAKNLGFDGGTM
jgi:hypothetical protein